MKKIFLYTLVFPLIFLSCENSDVLSDDELIEAIIEADNRISVSKNDYCLNMDQASLNKIIYENLNDVNFFSSKYNYLCKNKMPSYDKKNNYFCLPDYPFEKINIIHLTQISPYDIFDIRTTTGEVIKKKIIYEQ